ncbi:MAG: alpha/beta hydrolase [Christensenellaceae bacterium]|nr:alpha/beta hydrolase [Christensenellaceae bacterium]
MMKFVSINPDITLAYEEYGSGDRYVLSAQVGFAPHGMQQMLAQMGYHVYCITLRGFAPSTLLREDYGENWYDIFADDVAAFADKMGIGQFDYMGASHGAGVGWHLTLRHPDRVQAFIAVVAGPHSLDAGTLSYRQMVLQGLIASPPPMDPPIDNDDARVRRRQARSEWLSAKPEPDPLEKAVDYRRPLLRLGSEENLKAALRTIQTPTLLIGGVDDPISTPELLIRTAKCLPHCKLVLYANCGHNVDTDLIEETCGEADRFIRTAHENGKWYAAVMEP